MSYMLDQRAPYWDEGELPQPVFKRWRDALCHTESRALTALLTLASTDATQLLFMLPRLLDQLDHEGTTAQAIAPELRALAGRYGGTVVYLRHLADPAKDKGRAEEGDT